MGTTAQETPWMAEGEEKREFVRGMFADVAASYDLVNSLMSFRLHYKWRRKAVQGLGLKAGDRSLDVCCGTGDFLVELKKVVGAEGRVAGVDFCAPMLDKARAKSPGAVLSLGDACSLPFASGIFDAVTVGWGLRNVPDIGAALREANRVLKPGGRFVTLDMARPKTKIVGRMSEFVFHSVVPRIGRLFGKSRAYTYLPKSTLHFLSREQMKEAMQDAGFEDVMWQDAFFGNICTHWGTKP